MLLRSFEPGVDTFDLVRLCALRMWVIISPIGSFRFIVGSSLPARLDQSGDQPLGAEFSNRDAAHLQLAVIAPCTAGHLTSIADTRRRAVARQGRELDGCVETFLERLILIACDRPETRPLAGKLLGQPAPPVVLLDRTRLRHSCLLGIRVWGRSRPH